MQGNTPAFLHEIEEVEAAIAKIEAAYWVSTDTETTGLTDSSEPVTLGMQDWKQGASATVRMRTIQARIPTVQGRKGPRENFAFDCDKMGPALTQRVARAILSRKIFIAHNAGFDLYWLRRADCCMTLPEMVVDTMLLTRLLEPELVLRRAEMCAGIRHINEVPQQSPLVQAAWKSLIGGASGGSLADVVLAMFEVVVDKTYQKPENWTGLLGFEHYDYAIDDVVWADRILCRLLKMDEEGDLYQGYLGIRARKATVRLLEPQVPDLVRLRETGMPLSPNVGRRYVIQQREVLARKVDELIELEPELEVHRGILADPSAGLTEDLKQALAKAFEGRGVVLRRTAATGAPQVGEKDLRACRAVQMEESRPLFNAWVAVCRAKKSSNMAVEVMGFASRSSDGRLRSLLSHGPVTGRLSAAEPNCQQFPRDQIFRAMVLSNLREGCETVAVTASEATKAYISRVAEKEVGAGETVTVDSAWLAVLFWVEKTVGDWPEAERKAMEDLIQAQFTHVIISSDFGALDVRVGAALCIRSQREMLALARGHAVPGPVQPSDKIVEIVKKVTKALAEKDPAKELAYLESFFKKKVETLESNLDRLKEQLEKGEIQRQKYFILRGERKEELLGAKLGWRFAQCLGLGGARGEQEYSALRDAFNAEIDIHTFTGMKLVGRDPMKEFEGLSSSERKAYEKKLKKELGPRRQQGKIANLSLLYGMADAGFQEAAARGYDEHWTIEEAGELRSLWMNAYPEVELWHLWTECLQMGVVYLPEQGKEKMKRTGYWMARTLAGRDIVAFGLNAALSYQDQSTGADILGMIMHKFATSYPSISQAAINQVHDEVVFAVPVESFETDLPIIEEVMVGEANALLMPYGVPAAVSPACGPIWVKD